MTDRSFEILKIILDKLLIGALLVIAGLFGNQFLENYKSNLALRNEISKIQAQKFGEVWEKAFYNGTTVIKFAYKLIEVKEKALADQQLKSDEDKKAWIISEIRPEYDMISLRLKETEEAAARNRFWLGDCGHDQVAGYSNAFSELVSAP